MEVVIVGSIGYDDIETSVDSGSDLLGGSAVHAGLSSSFHLPIIPEKPARVGIIGPVGRDFKNRDKKLLETRGIDISNIMNLDGKTFRWSGKYGGDMEDVETISTELNVLGDFNPIIPDEWDSPNIVFCANTHPLIQISVFEQCQNAGISAIDTFKLWIESEFEYLSQAMRMADIAILNEEEACAIARTDMIIHAIEPILSGSALYGGESLGRGPNSLIIKRGSSGVLAKFPCGLISLPAYPTSKIVDPTGCGDSFAGAFLANISSKLNSLNDIEIVRNALIHAIVTSSFSIGNLGSFSIQNLERGVYHARLDSYRRIVGL